MSIKPSSAMLGQKPVFVSLHNILLCDALKPKDLSVRLPPSIARTEKSLGIFKASMARFLRSGYLEGGIPTAFILLIL